MPWSTPTLRQVRSNVRDAIHSALPGSDALVPNSILRVLSDAMGALCHLTLQYIDWLALQLLPDTAEHVWLDRHGNIWLVNADSSTGRKLATLATGTVTVSGTNGVVLPSGSTISGPGVGYETTAEITVGTVDTPVAVRALDPGTIGNQEPGAQMSLDAPPVGILGDVTVVTLENGTDDETDDELRDRVLRRIREPPVGGSKTDYEHWALAVPGVTRAWCAPLEMGIGTVTVRFMMDDLRADNDGFPLPTDVQAVADYIDSVRPVAVKDIFVLAPIPYPIDFDIANLVTDTADTRAGIENSAREMIRFYGAPGQTIFAAWKSMAVMSAPNVYSFDLINTEDDIMPDLGHLATLGDIYYSLARVPPPADTQAIAHSSHG